MKIFSQVKGNPVGSNVEEGVKAFKEGHHNGVIALGGGSGLDVGKAIAFMSGQTLSIWEFEDIGDNWSKANPDTIEGAQLAFNIAPYMLKKINNKKIPLMASLLKAISKNKKLTINW